MTANAREWRRFLQNQSRPGQAIGVMLHATIQPHPLEVMSHVAALSPKRVVYVSCNPVTLARDSQVLVKGGYRLARLGMLDMFPHTGHLESMALFERD